MKERISEPWLIFIIGSVMFINILDFMMVMPLGPDFALALGIPTKDIGWIGGIYTFAAAISGFISSLFLDNFDRRRALLFTLLGLAIATLSCAFAWNFHSLMAARFLAGCFGGPLTSVAIAIIADNIPPERRGAAMGKVMGAFSVASILGVPFGLEISRIFGWKAPFLALCAIALCIFMTTIRHLPKMDKFIIELKISERLKIIRQIITNPLSLFTFAMMGLTVMSAFMIIPNMSAHLQFNINYPREKLGLLYLIGGVISFFGMRWAGKFTDKYGAFIVNLISTIVFIAVVLAGFVFYHYPWPVVVLFPLFMLASSARNVCGQTISSQVPPPHERAAFNSIQSSIVHICSATGAFLASEILMNSDGRKLVGIEYIGYISVALSLIVPVLLYKVSQGLRRRTVLTPVIEL